MGSVENPHFAKQNDRNSDARSLTDIPTKRRQKKGYGAIVAARRAKADDAL